MGRDADWFIEQVGDGLTDEEKKHIEETVED